MTNEERQQMGLDCIEVIKKKMEGKLTPEEYYIALMELHRKYPMPGHEPPLTPFHYANYLEIKEHRSYCAYDSHVFVEHEDHLQPLNFQEAAEMYIRHWERLNKEKPSIFKPPLKKRQEVKERLRYADD